MTFSNNGLVIGDSYTFREIQFPDPGNGGSKQIWDFSGIQYTGKSQVSNMQSAADQKLAGAANYNLSLKNQTVGGALLLTKLAYTNTLQQSQIKSGSLTGTNISPKSVDPAISITKSEVSVTLSPNPFIDKLTYTYSLSEPLPVSIELYSMAGKNIGSLFNIRTQPVGLHTGELNPMMYSLSSGVYFLRFIFDKQVVIRKVVEI